MRNTANLATAYVQIVPTAKGIKGQLESIVGNEAAAAGTSGGKTLASKLGGALGTVGKLAGAAVAAGAGAAAAVAKQAIDSYAEYEQLAGGAQLMFGDAYDAVAKRAANAYATVQMSQNEYLQQVNGFATGLKTALGGNESAAADLADRILTAEADIVAATGASQEAVQNAFAGVMRSNYSMLDNLQLGITPTKEGFQELIDKVNEWNAANGRATAYEMGNLADMESALVDYVNMVGMAGYAQNEAADTISGSLASMKAAWANLLTGVASGNADIGKLTGNLMASVKTFGSNLLPVVKTALKGLTEVVRDLAPEIAAELPGLVADLAPDLVSAAVAIAVSLGTALAENAPEIVISLVQAITANAPALITGGVQLVISLVTGLLQGLPQLAVEAGKLVLTVAGAVGEGVLQMLSAGGDLVRGLWEGISGAAGWLWNQVSGWLSGLWEGIKDFFETHSPSRKTEWLGEMLPEGLAQGITASADDAVAAATAMSADVLGAMSGDEYGLTATGAGAVEIRHTGTIRVEGVGSEGELVAVTDIIYDQLITRLRQEVRYA